MIRIETFTHEPFRINSYLVWEDENRDGLLVDAGRDVARIIHFVERHKLQVSDLLHTHAFIEFMEGQPTLRDTLDVTAHMNPMDEFWLAHFHTQAIMLNVEHVPLAFIEQQLLPGDTLCLGGHDSFKVNVLGTPGNSPGGVCYYLPEAQAVFTGDVIYAGCLGATDIPHGSLDKLVESIQREIFSLPDETILYPGRGPSTTVGEEKASNSLISLPYGNTPADAWS